MSRLLLLCLLVSANAYGKGIPPFSTQATTSLFSPTAFVDTIPPTIQCPPSDTLALGVGDCDTIYNYTVTASDDQPPFILIQLSGLASGSAFPAGTTINSFLVTDLAGNTATCSFTVTVISAGNTLVCDDYVEVPLGAFCEVIVQPEDVLIPPYGCTGDDVVEVDETPPYGNGPWVLAYLGEDDLGKTYAVRVRDIPSGNTCWGNLKVIDAPPTITCADISVHCGVEALGPSFLYQEFGIADAFPTVVDNCPFVNKSYVDVAQNLPCNPANNLSGTVTRFWTATDKSGLTATCQQTINRIRSFDDIQFPPSDTVSCGLENNLDSTGTPFLRINNIDFLLWPASFCEFELNYYDTLLIAYCGGSSKIKRTWKVFDLCQALSPSNPFVGTQIIDFVDGAGPVLECAPDLTISADATDCLADVDLPDVQIDDDCSPIESVVAYWVANDAPDTLAGTLTLPDTMGVFGIATGFPVGTTTVTYVAVDACGNTSSCETVVTIWDMQPPTPGCITFFTVTLGAESAFWLGADTLDLTSKDSCSQELSFKMRRTLANSCQPNDQFFDAVRFCCADIGDTIELTRRVYDVDVPDGPVAANYAAGQFSDCTVKVEVLDTLAIGCAAPPDVVTDCTNFDPLFSDYGTASFTCKTDSIALTVNYAQFDTSCQEGAIVRTFRVFDQNGSSAECVQQITVSPVQDYYIKFPDDKIVTVCDGTNNYGSPSFLSNGCEALMTDFSDEIFTVVPDACFKIERTWFIYNLCDYDTSKPFIVVPNPNPNATLNHPNNLLGPTVMPDTTVGTWNPSVVAITPGQPPTNFSIFWDADANGYKYKQIIKVIDQQDPSVLNCPSGLVSIGDTTTNDPLLWNQSYWWDATIESNNMADGPTPLSITATDACSGGNLNITYLLFLDLDGDGAQETVINSNNPPVPGTVNYNNIGNPNYGGGQVRTFDGRSVPFHEIYRWANHQSVSGNQRTASVHWKTFAQLPTSPANPFGLPGIAPQLPYGTHRIKWTVTDGCGNEHYCEYIFTVEDVKKPVVACLGGLNVELLPTQLITIFAVDFLQYGDDNYTPYQKLKYAIRKAGQGTGFPVDGNGNPIVSVTFGCADLGINTVELWAQDLSSNAGFCTTTLTLTDADSSCTSTFLTVGGALKTETDDAVANADVAIAATHPIGWPLMLNTQSDAQGDFEFLQSIPVGSTYTLTPSKDINPLNGVSTFDILLITKHILGLDFLNSPYKMIAADANRSNSITTFDVVEIRKLILGIYTDFPNNTSWRFVDKDYVFPAPANLFQSPFPETIVRVGVVADQLADDFVGIKVGDVNNTANGDNLLAATDDRARGVLFFDVKNREVRAGETFTAHFKAAEKSAGYQFTLNFEGLEVMEVLPGEGMGLGNFAVFQNLPGQAWTGAITASVENGASEFSIKFHSRKAGQLSEMLSISSSITKAEAYSTSSEVLDIALLFDNRLISKVGFELYQNQPNPFRDKTSIGFYLPENADATLTVFNETGRVLFAKSNHYLHGHNSVSIEQTLLGDAGVLFYKLETAAGSAVRKMVLIK